MKILNLYSCFTGPASLFDITGRKVIDLRPGANDVRQLTPGVYFVRQGSDANRVAKIMITR
ncbi:MAG: T9SS type A sorting domain-containing protein [candidate division WOR-3 bacterium]|uniref:T9SS type A sorting domain-containing protein n=1 Tax=candidate division WOR-3 bacterium TaxID=2052148 RepID=A0A7C3IYA6_UNCW3|nr:T9SS type A sorting domain-containing protein [candidate division WOR-3 bacterium]